MPKAPHIRFAEPGDISAAERICRSAFSLTAIDTDPMLNLRGGDYLYRFYAQRAFEKYPANCFVAEIDGTPSGFIIIGNDADFSARIGKRVGSILLLGVLPELQGRGIGQTLIQTAINHFRKEKFSLVSVGTDADNTSALCAYEKKGFRTILNWATFRRYPPHAAAEPSPVRLEKTSTDVSFIEKYDYLRTHSFFYDKRLPLDAVREKHSAHIAAETASGVRALYRVFYLDKEIGFLSIRDDAWMTEFTGRRFVRIEDCHIIPQFALDNAGVVRQCIAQATVLAGSDVMEAWTALNRFTYINALTAGGFSFVHAAQVLHLWL
ncbi:MAG: GNAT family N-acetyltransferase [Spirochaetes bacterium]|nr:GNAT family N-acetyltransferase [Spirochaetota bacterium]